MSRQVIIYSTPACGYCHMLKDYLKEKNIEFTDFDVAQDKDRAQEMVDKSGQMGVPVMVIKHESGQEDLIVGFDKNKVDQIFNIS